jgi:aryl-alcohol dehydrogenase-like predicted oxidoreductase
MQYRSFGSTDLKASVVGFGVWTVSTSMWGINDHDVRLSLLRRAYDLGITFYDTADVYGDGTGETIIHEALGSHRGDLTIATKFGYDFYNYPGPQPGQRERPHDWSANYIREACEKSLARLGTDYVDLYQLHNPREHDIRNDEVFETLDDLRTAGKIRHYGVALGPAIDIRQSAEGVAAFEDRNVTSVQIIFNLLEQMLGKDVFAAARLADGGVMCRVPHASGLLEGVYTTETEFAPNDHRQFRVKTNEARKEWLDRGLERVKRLDFLTNETGRTLSQAALQFALSEPTMACAIPNIYDIDQLEEFAAASDVPSLTSAEIEKIGELYARDFGLMPETSGVS